MTQMVFVQPLMALCLNENPFNYQFHAKRFSRKTIATKSVPGESFLCTKNCRLEINLGNDIVSERKPFAIVSFRLSENS